MYSYVLRKYKKDFNKKKHAVGTFRRISYFPLFQKNVNLK